MALEGKSQEEIAALAALADDVLTDPKYAGTFKRMLKAKNPNLSMPDVELEDRARAEFAKRDKTIEELQNERAQDKAERQTNEVYENLRDAGTVTSRANFSELVTWAGANGFLTTEMGLKKAGMARAAEMEAAEPTPQAIGPGSNFAVADNADDAKSFMKDATGHARQVAARAMDELRATRAKGTKTH